MCPTRFRNNVKQISGLPIFEKFYYTEYSILYFSLLISFSKNVHRSRSNQDLPSNNFSKRHLSWHQQLKSKTFYPDDRALNTKFYFYLIFRFHLEKFFFLLHCIFVNLVNIMLLTADLQSPLSEHSTSTILIFFVMPCLRDRLVKSFISLST